MLELLIRDFRNEIGKSMEVYVDDMLGKCNRGASHISNLGKTFKIIRH